MQLEPHREELLRLRRAGESVAVLCTGLRGLGVEISDEALRQWLNRELGHKPTRRRKVGMKFDRRGLDTISLVAAQAERTTTTLPAAVTNADPAETEFPPETASGAPDQPSSLILPGETPLQAFHRRLAALGAAQAKEGCAN